MPVAGDIGLLAVPQVGNHTRFVYYKEYAELDGGCVVTLQCCAVYITVQLIAAAGDAALIFIQKHPPPSSVHVYRKDSVELDGAC
jgi:hypothetical protein